MKKYLSLGLVALMILALAGGCAKAPAETKKEPEKETPKVETPVADDENFAASFEKALAESSVQSLWSMLVGRESLKETDWDLVLPPFMEKLHGEVDSLNEVLKEGTVQEALQQVAESVVLSPDALAALPDEVHQKLMPYLSEVVILCKGDEGSFKACPHYDRLKSLSSLSFAWQDYFTLKAEDQANPVTQDGKLAISYDELGKRLLAWERFTKNYAIGPHVSDVQSMLKEGTRLLFNGMPEGSHINENGMIRDEVKAAYETVAADKETVLGQTMGRFLELLREKNFTYDDEVKAAAERLLEQHANIMENGK